MQTGPPRKLTDAQADEGFAFVPEATCKELLEHYGGVAPEEAENVDVDYKTAISLALLAKIQPDLTDLQAAARLNKAFIAEHPNCYSDLYIDPECLLDCVDKTEADKVQKFEAKIAHHRAKKEMAVETRCSLIHNYFKKTKPPKYSAEQKKPPRWLPKKFEANTKAITEWIKDHLPEGISIICDNYNGRWRIFSMNLDWLGRFQCL